MSTSLDISPSLYSDSSLASLLDYFQLLKPQSLSIPSQVTSLIPCNSGALAGLADGKVVFIDIFPGIISYELQSDRPHVGVVWSLAVSKDWKLAVSGGADGMVKMWDVEEKREIASFEGHRKEVRSVVMTGSVGVSGGGDGVVKVWDLKEWREAGTLDSGLGDTVSAMEVSEDGERCAVGGSTGGIQIWDLGSRKLVGNLEGHTGEITGLRISSDRKYLWSGSLDTTVRAWDLLTYQLLFLGVGHKDKITAPISTLQNGQKCISASQDRTIKVWSLHNKQEIATLTGHEKYIFDMAVSKNEKFCVTCGFNRGLKLWDLESGKEVVSFEGCTGSVLKVILTDDNHHFLTASGETIRVWSLMTRIETSILHFNENVYNLTVNEEYVIIANGCDVVLWSAEGNKEVAVLKGHTGVLFDIALVGSGKEVLTASADRSIRLWDLHTHQCTFTFLGHTNIVTRLAVCPRSHSFLSISLDKTLKLWSLDSNCVLHTVDAYCPRYGLIVSPDERFILATGFDSSITIWSLRDMTVTSVLKGENNYTFGLAITPDGSIALTGTGDGTIQMWNIKENRLIASLSGHRDKIMSIKISPDGQFMLSASDDNTVKIWSLTERRAILTLFSHSEEANIAVFSPDMKSVITGSTDKTVHITPFLIPWETSDTSKLTITSELTSILTTLRKGRLLSETAANTLISPYHINSLHVSAHFNHSERCEDYLNMNVPFVRGRFGSPLTVSLGRRTIKCTEVFIKYLISRAEREKEDNAWPVFACVIEDIPGLLRSGSSHLEEFFSVLMRPPATPSLPQFITPTSPLPIVIFSDSRLLNITDFDQCKSDELGSDLVKFSISFIRKNVTPGSYESLEFLEALKSCEDKKVLNTPYISQLIHAKWDYFYPYTLTLTILYAVLITVMVMLMFGIGHVRPLVGVFLLLNVFFLIYEVVQMATSFTTYWLDVWNYVDLCRGILCQFWGFFVFFEVEKDVLGVTWHRNIRLFLCLMCLLRGFTLFHSFRMTRIFVYLTLSVITEMYSFLIIMAYSVFAFGICSSVLVEDTSLTTSWTNAFRLVLGDFESGNFSLVEWLVFMCAAIVNVIIMLNLLVSILGDAYEKTRISLHEHDLYMMLVPLLEYEYLSYWRRNEGQPTILTSCSRVQTSDQDSDWSGVVVDLKNTVRREMETGKEELGMRIEELGKEVKEMKEEMRRKMREVEGNLETILMCLKENREIK